MLKNFQLEVVDIVHATLLTDRTVAKFIERHPRIK